MMNDKMFEHFRNVTLFVKLNKKYYGKKYNKN